MSTDLKVPTLPESVTDATVLSWHKQPGDQVSRDENLVDLETDKVVLEVPAPQDGILASISAGAGAVVKSGDMLGVLEPGGGQKENPASKPPPKQEREPGPEAAVEAKSEPVLTPSVRRLVKEMNLDPTRIPATGKDGRLLKSDVMQYLDQRQPAVDPDLAAMGSMDSSLPRSTERNERRVTMSRLRARIAERLLDAQRHAAILTTFNEVNLHAIKTLREQHKERFEHTHGVRLGFMSFFVTAVIESLRKFPIINATIDGSDIIYHDYYDIGIAVGSPRGLVVPILRNADTLGFAQIEHEIRKFGKRAQLGTLDMDDLTGGTFTISNGGVYGSMLSTPILNPPQSAILGMHNIIDRPIVENGDIVVRPMMYLALSYDHRIIDGKDAVQFLVSIKEFLEDPSRLLLQL